MHSSQRTTLRFHCAVLSEQSCDSLTGQGERASIERRIAAGRLQDIVRSQQQRVKNNNKRFILFISFDT